MKLKALPSPGRGVMKLAITVGAALFLTLGVASCRSASAVSDDGQAAPEDANLTRVVLQVPTIT